MSPRIKETNSLSISILGFFKERPYHGYELYKYMTQIAEFDQIWHVKQSLFYGLLDSFHKDGYLQLRIVEGNQYPDRKEYQLTDSGRELLGEWLVTPVHHGRDMRQEFLAKLYFAFREKGELALRLIDTQKKECQTWMQQFAANQPEMQETYPHLIHEYRRHQIEAMITWLDYLLFNESQIHKLVLGHTGK